MIAPPLRRHGHYVPLSYDPLDPAPAPIPRSQWRTVVHKLARTAAMGAVVGIGFYAVVRVVFWALS
jgi:hypothetical protein